ncbi:MAG TPA: transporter [Caldimonas sp.]|nr:transporter [Caldimonas sp.]HEX4234409.1 transporter [Caldimonas sp.]
MPSLPGVELDVVQRRVCRVARRFVGSGLLPKTVALAAKSIVIVASMSGAPARAQDIEPRAYSNAPVGVNFLVAGVAHSSGGLSLDPSIPVTDAKLDTNIAVLAYARVLDLWGVSGKFDVIVPYASLSGTAEYAGAPVQRSIHGFANSAFRLSANLYGAPALAMKDFAAYRQDLIVGASLQVVAPTSQYDPTRLVNIGTHRWSFKPELGVSKAIDRWTIEGQAAVTLYTDNTNFYGGSTRSQDPLYAFQGHVIYGFRSGAWTSFDATYFTGGRSSIDGAPKNDLQQNWRLGATLALPIDRRNSVKLYASSGVSARTGNNFDLLGVVWQYRWGGGI